ncbi:MAG: MBL fold metallo-hydrolase [Thermodesulfobacteriota bacterium]|nr:MBL fold metallo-hydrolase [Thermodesulfobacteriota bacterium]
MSKWDYTKGLHDLGNGVYAYLWPDGSWGLNNTGLIVDGEKSLLIDTLFDLASTQEMLDAMRKKENAATSINTLVITHGNGDHYYGNELVKGAEIIASKACAKEMAETSPQMMAHILKAAPDMGDVGIFFAQCFGQFTFDDISPIPPTLTFEGYLDITVGNKKVQLIEVGPAHTQGDVIVYIPDDRIVFAGDILFIGGTPIMWVGPVGNWIQACDLMLEMDVETFVPGHGPITDKKGVRAVKEYWEYVYTEAKKRFDAGLSVDEASDDISLGEYAFWGDKERIVVNLSTLYRELSGETSSPNPLELFSKMAEFRMRSTDG